MIYNDDDDLPIVLSLVCGSVRKFCFDFDLYMVSFYLLLLVGVLLLLLLSRGVFSYTLGDDGDSGDWLCVDDYDYELLCCCIIYIIYPLYYLIN